MAGMVPSEKVLALIREYILDVLYDLSTDEVWEAGRDTIDLYDYMHFRDLDEFFPEVFESILSIVPAHIQSRYAKIADKYFNKYIKENRHIPTIVITLTKAIETKGRVLEYPVPTVTPEMIHRISEVADKIVERIRERVK